MSVEYKSATYEILTLEGSQARAFAANAARLPSASRSGVKAYTAIVMQQTELIAPEAAADARSAGWTSAERLEFYELAKHEPNNQVNPGVWSGDRSAKVAVGLGCPGETNPHASCCQPECAP